MRDGISVASGLCELWIAGGDDGGLDHGRDGADQQLLPAAGSECDSVHGAAAGGEGAQTVLLSYLPLAPLAPATAPLVSLAGTIREAAAGGAAGGAAAGDRRWRFRCRGNGRRSIRRRVDFDPKTGELTLPWNLLGLPYNEVMATYTAGLATIGDDVISACAQIVRNAQAKPALNASMSKMDTMQMKYFSSSLIDETVQAWLSPYVANRLG